MPILPLIQQANGAGSLCSRNKNRDGNLSPNLHESLHAKNNYIKSFKQVNLKKI